MKTALFLVLFFTSSLYAQTYVPSTEAQCSPIDLREDLCPDGTPRLPALRNQGLTNYCSSYSTVEVFSYVTCKKLSALSLGILNDIAPSSDPAKSSDQVNNGGSPRTLHERFATRADAGPCLESDFPSSPQVILGKLKNKKQRFIAHSLKLPQIKKGRFIASVEDEDEENSSDEESSEQVNEFAAKGKESQAQENFTQYLMNFYNRRNQANPVGCARQDVTQVRLSPSVPNARAANVSNRDLQRALNSALAVNRSPAIMSVRADGVFDPVNRNSTSVRSGEMYSDHFVTVVGRRWMNGHCHYLYRDSGAVDQSPWPRAADHPNQAPSNLDSNSFYYLWVREENLLNNTDDIVHHINSGNSR